MTFCVSLNNGDAPSMFLAPSKLYMLTSFCVTHRHLKRRQQRRQHKNFEGSKCLILGEKHFCLGYRLSKHKITIYSKNFGGSIAPLAIPGNHPWQRLWTQMSSCVAQCVYPLQTARNLSWPGSPGSPHRLVALEPRPVRCVYKQYIANAWNETPHSSRHSEEQICYYEAKV